VRCQDKRLDDIRGSVRRTNVIHVFFRFVNVFEHGREGVVQFGPDIWAAVAQLPVAASAPTGRS
jgi:hypothetical protein